MGLLSANALMGPLSLLGAGMVCPIPSGRCAEPFWVRDFFWFRQLLPGDKNYRRGADFILSFYARAGPFPTCTDARESVQILEENLAPV